MPGADVFSHSNAREQYVIVRENIGNVEALKEFYPYARDDMVRSEIVMNTRDVDLANNLFDRTKYATLKVKLLPLIFDEEKIKNFLLTYANDSATTQALVNKLSGDDARIFNLALKQFNISGTAQGDIDERVKQNPVTE